MLGRSARLPLQMNRPLEGQLGVRSHPRKSRDAWIYRFKIREVERVSQPFSLALKFRAIPRLPHLNARARTTQPLRERVILWDVVNRLNAESDKFCHRRGMDSGESQNVVVRNRGIAMIKKLASEWIAALSSSRNIGSLRHREDSKF